MEQNKKTISSVLADQDAAIESQMVKFETHRLQRPLFENARA